MQERKRLLLVGAGRWGQILLKNFYLHPSACVVGIVSSKSSLENTEPDTKIFSTLDAALEQKWDGILLATPPSVHAKQLLELIPRGIPVFVEKPLALSLVEANECLTLQEKFHCPVFVDHIHLFQPAIEWIKREIPPAEILTIESCGANYGPFRTDYSPLWDYGSHDLSVILDLLGSEPTSFSVKTADIGIVEGGMAGTYSVELQFTQNQNAAFTVGNLNKTKIRFYKIETKEEIFFFSEFPEKKFTRENKKTGALKEIKYEWENPLSKAIAAFLLGLDGKFDSRWGLKLGHSVTKLLSALETKTQA